MKIILTHSSNSKTNRQTMIKTIYLTLLFLIFSVTNGISQQISQNQQDSIKYWCSKTNGIENVKKIIDKINKQDRGIQAALLKKTYDEILTIDAESWCARLSKNPPKTIGFTYDTTGRRTFEFYSSYECESNWNGSCEGDEDLILPARWQACSCLYNVTSQRGNADSPVVTPIQWYEGDSEYPNRFRGYRIKLRSSGNNELLNRVGANISLSNVRIIAIPSDFTNEDRYKLGCDMPIYPAIKPNKTSTKVDIEPAKTIKAEYIYSSKKCSYNVYTAKGGGTISCDSWSLVGEVTPIKSVKIPIQQGENILIRVMKKNSGVCKTSKIKREDNVFLKPNSTKSSIIKYELHDWECE